MVIVIHIWVLILLAFVNPETIRDYLDDLCLMKYNRVNMDIIDIQTKLDEELIEV